MRITDFPFCCTGKVLVGFGESNTAQADWNGRAAERMSHDQKIDWITNELARYKRGGMAFISCTTNNQQKEINAVLKELGFRHSKWMSKKQHANTKVRIWWYCLEDFNEND